LESIKEVIIWQVGNVEIADIRSKRIPPRIGVHPAKKNASFSTTPVIPRTANLKALTSEYDFKVGIQAAQDKGLEIAGKLFSPEEIIIGRIY
jgi:hypothetical protein